MEEGTERAAPWRKNATNTECGSSATFAKARKRVSPRLCVVGNESGHLPFLLARCVGTVPMALRLRAGRIRSGAILLGMDSDGGESVRARCEVRPLTLELPDAAHVASRGNDAPVYERTTPINRTCIELLLFMTVFG